MLTKSSIARWTRTLSTMFAAGVPLVDALDSVGGAAGNYVYEMGTKKIQSEVSTGSSLTVSMENSGLFPPMVTQMVAIGEKLDGHRLLSVSDYQAVFEKEGRRVILDMRRPQEPRP